MAEPQAPPPEQQTDADGGGPLVLVVDDYESGREIASEYFSWNGFRVATAEDGEEALEKAFALAPDVILMDLSLPKLSGWEATKLLRQDERTRDTPILALTAHALERELQRARDAGCSAVVTKPVVPRELVVMVKDLLAKSGD